MSINQFLSIKPRLLQHLDLPHKHFLQWADELALLLSVRPDAVRKQRLHELRQILLTDCFVDQLDDLLADGSDLRRLCIAGLLNLSCLLFCEANDKDSEEIPI